MEGSKFFFYVYPKKILLLPIPPANHANPALFSSSRMISLFSPTRGLVLQPPGTMDCPAAFDQEDLHRRGVTVRKMRSRVGYGKTFGKKWNDGRVRNSKAGNVMYEENGRRNKVPTVRRVKKGPKAPPGDDKRRRVGEIDR